MQFSPLQPALDEWGTPLAQVTFCVVDLETTGAGPDSSITEFGAVRVCGGEVTGEFQTLVNPGEHIPAVIALLTGITDSMVASAPRLDSVLPGFLEFSRGCVIVAHNAPFDVGFLKRACQQLGYEWPQPQVIDTVSLARSVLLRDEVPNCKLATLAAHFGTTTTPNHRALSDARATVDVLHGLIERIGNLGVDTLEDLAQFQRRVSPQRRAKRKWAANLPARPGVYFFVSDSPGQRQVLYVGKSTNLRRRVGGYFTASETRSRMDEMVRIATGVETVECVTPLQAEVLELRLIATHSPRYNRRSKFPERQSWVKLTAEAFPRLSLVREVRDDAATYFGPFASRASAEETVLALYDAFPIRQCNHRLSTRTPRQPCALAELGRCSAPCELGEGAASYEAVVSGVRNALQTDVRDVLHAVRDRMTRLVSQQRYEEAASISHRMETFSKAAVRHHRVASLASCSQLVAARPDGDGGWEIHVVRHGRLAAAARARPGDVPQAVARDAVRTAESVAAPPSPRPAASIEETERIAAWLEAPGVRLIELEGDWSWPVHVGLPEGALARHLLGPDPEPIAV